MTLSEHHVDVGNTLFQREAAAALGVTPRTLRRWHRSGFGPRATRAGGAMLYDRAAVLAFKAGAR